MLIDPVQPVSHILRETLDNLLHEFREVGGQAVLGRQNILPTPWLTERHGYDPTFGCLYNILHLSPFSVTRKIG